MQIKIYSHANIYDILQKDYKASYSNQLKIIGFELVALHRIHTDNFVYTVTLKIERNLFTFKELFSSKLNFF